MNVKMLYNIYMGGDLFDINIVPKNNNNVIDNNETFKAIKSISADVDKAEREINKLNPSKHHHSNDKFNLQSNYDLQNVSIPLNNIYTTSGKALHKTPTTIIPIDDDILPDVSGFENTIRKQRKNIDELLANNEALKKDLQASKDRIAQLEGENKKLTGEKQELEQQLNRNKELLRENEAKLFRKLKDFLTRIANKTRANINAVNLRREGSNYLDNLKNYLDVCSRILLDQIDRNNLESENDKKEIEELKRQKNLLNDQIIEQAQVINNLIIELDNTLEQYEESKERDGYQISHLINFIREQEANYNALNQRLIAEEARADQLTLQLANADDQNALLQVDKFVIINERDALEAQLISKLSEIDDLQLYNDIFLTQIDNLNDDKRILQNQLNGLIFQVGQLGTDLVNLRQQSDLKDDMLVAMQREIDLKDDRITTLFARIATLYAELALKNNYIRLLQEEYEKLKTFSENQTLDNNRMQELITILDNLRVVDYRISQETINRLDNALQASQISVRERDLTIKVKETVIRLQKIQLEENDNTIVELERQIKDLTEKNIRLENRRIPALNDQVIMLFARIRNLNERIKLLQGIIDERDKTISETKEQLGRVNREKNEAMRIIHILNRQVEDKNNTIDRLNIKNRSLEKSLAVSNAIRSKFNRQKNTLQEENNRLIRIIYDRDTRIERLIKQRDDIDSKNERLNAEINILQEEKKQLSEEISRQNISLSQFANDIQIRDQRINWLTEQLSNATILLEQSNKNTEDLVTLINKNRGKYNMAKAKLQAEENENKDLGKKFQSTGDTLYKLEIKYDSLLIERQQKQNEIDRLNKEVLSISTSGSEIKRDNTELLNRIEVLQIEIQSKDTEIKSLKDEIRYLRAEIQNLQYQIGEKDKFLREQKASIEALWLQLLEVNQELEEKNRENTNLAVELKKERKDLVEEKIHTLNLTNEIAEKNRVIYNLQLFSGKLASNLLHKNKIINFIFEEWKHTNGQRLQVKEELLELEKKYNELNREFLKNKSIYGSALEEIQKLNEEALMIKRLENKISSLRAQNKKHVKIINYARAGIHEIMNRDELKEAKEVSTGYDIIENLSRIKAEIGLLKHKISKMITREEMKKQKDVVRLETDKQIRYMRVIIQSQKDEIKQKTIELKSEEKNKGEIERLNMELSDLRNLLQGSEEIKQQLEISNIRIKELESIIELQVNEIERIKKELELEKKNNSQNKEILDIANARIGELSMENLNLKQTIGQQSADNDALNKKNIELTEQLLASKLAIRFLLLGRRALKEENDKQIAGLNNKNEEQKVLIRQQEALIEEQKLQLTTKQKELKKLKIKLRKNEKKMKKRKPDNLDSILKKLKNRHEYENIGIPDENPIDKEELKNLKEEVDGLKLLVREKELKVQNQAEEAERHNVELFETNKRLLEENERIKKENIDFRSKNVNLNAEVERYLRDLTNINDRSEEIKALSTSNETLRKELEKKDILIAENSIELKKASEDRVALEKSQQAILVLQKEIESHKLDIETRGNNYQSLYESNEFLKKKLEKIDEKEQKLADDVSFIEQIKNLDSKFYLYYIYKYIKKKIENVELIRIYDEKYKINKIIYKIREIINNITLKNINDDLGSNDDTIYSMYKSVYIKFLGESNFDTTIKKVINNIKDKLKLNINAIIDIIDFLDPLTVIYNDIKSIDNEYKNLNEIIYELVTQFLLSLIQKSEKKLQEKIMEFQKDEAPTDEDFNAKVRELLLSNKIIEYSNQINLTSGQINRLFDCLEEIRGKSYNVENFDLNKRNDLSNTGNSKLDYIFNNIICDGKRDENIEVKYDELMEKINKIKQTETPIIVKGGSIADTLFLMFFNKYVCILVILLLVLLYFYIKCQRQKLNYRKSYRNYLLTINQN